MCALAGTKRQENENRALSKNHSSINFYNQFSYAKMDLIDGRDIKPSVDRRIASTSASSTSSVGGGSNAANNFSYPTTTALTNADICQMCILLGIQVICPNDATKRKHTDDHRRAAAAFLSLEDWALPPTEAQIAKCFPHYTPDFFQHQSVAAPATPQTVNNVSHVETVPHQRHNQPQPQPQPSRQQIQQQPQQQRSGDNEHIQRTVAAILFNANPNSSSTTKPRFSSAESREASISESVAAVAANACVSQLPAFDAATTSTSSVNNSKKSRSRSSGGPKKRAKTALSTLKNGDGTNDAKEVKEQFTKSVISAIETSLSSGQSEANFQLVRDKPSCKWPRFIIDGYAYRVGRVYSTGKCELRCILKQGCNGKAVVEKNGSGYIARIVPGSVHFHSPPAFTKTEPDV